MSYQFLKNETVEAGVQRIAREEIDRAIAEIEDRELDDHETVHQVRKRCKKMRGLIRLVRPQFEKTYQQENTWYRDAARELSDVRDAQSIIETYDKLLNHYRAEVERQTFDSIHKRLLARRTKIAEDEVRLKNGIEKFLEKMREGEKRIDSWSLDDKGFKAIHTGLQKTYGRGRNAMRAVYKKPTAENFHEWRKRVKYHWYHIRLLQPIWLKVLKKLRSELHSLSDYLGDEHDLGILSQTVSAAPEAFGENRSIGTFLDLIARRRQELRSEARQLGNRIFCEKPGQLSRRLGCYWEIWKNESK